jgi:hypothetical protein
MSFLANLEAAKRTSNLMELKSGFSKKEKKSWKTFSLLKSKQNRENRRKPQNFAGGEVRSKCLFAKLIETC